jgi:ribosome biogenesis GTPase
MAKKKKIRVDMRKNRAKPPRRRDWSGALHPESDEATPAKEQIRAKGELSRKRTIIQDDAGEGQSEAAEMPAVDVGQCLAGRVLRAHGLQNVVETEDGRQFRCAVRRLLKTLATEERSIVAPGDRVWIRLAPSSSPPRKQGNGGTNLAGPAGSSVGPSSEAGEGFIERVEPRHGMLTRASRGREHVLVANVDQIVIVVSLVEPDLKPHLIDRYLVSAEQGGITPIVCLNKVDLADPAHYQPLIGYYCQLGITAFLTSAVNGQGIDRLRKLLKDRETVFSGQSGVGKSSILNAIQPGLALQVREVSEATQKGRHTTTTAQLLRLDFGGWVVDTPGIRQFKVWDILPEELEGFFPEFRPYVHLCQYPDCTHTHEDRCAIKNAVFRRQISDHRYTSYLGLFHGTMQEVEEMRDWT